MTDKQTEALKLALKLARQAILQIAGAMPFPVGQKALAAIDEALAEQPAQPIKQGWDVDDLLDKPKQPAQQQEPVAYMGTDIEGNPNKFRLNPFDGGIPLYKKPQSVKVWDAEGYDALCQQLEGWKDRALKAEAKLREKNA